MRVHVFASTITMRTGPAFVVPVLALPH